MGKTDALSEAGLIRASAALSGGGPLVLCASEDVALFAAALPLRAHRQRVAAAPFAVEELLAESLGQTHVALGPMLSEGVYLVAAVNREVMETWRAAMDRAGLRRARLVPDVLTVPVPEGAGWRVVLREGRALVRRDDGTGFAVPDGVFPSLWQGAGTPALTLHGTAPEGWPLAAPSGPEPKETARTLPRGFDLGQGAFARDDRGGRRLRAAALVAATGLVLHGGITAYDTMALKDIAAGREDAVRARLAALVPGAAPAADPVAALVRLARPEAGMRQGPFLPLLARISDALAPLAARISFDTLVYSDDAALLAMGMRADDIATLQAVETALSGAGLSVTAGPTTTAGGGATARIEVGTGIGGAS